MGRHKNDIEKYLRGEMTAAEMHALEKEALHDPFLSEALEGIDRAGAENFLFDLKELHSSVYQRTKSKRIKIISMWNWSLGIAAGLVLLAVSSIYIFSLINKEQNEKSLALNRQPLTEKPLQKENDLTSDSAEAVKKTVDQSVTENPSPAASERKQAAHEKTTAASLKKRSAIEPPNEEVEDNRGNDAIAMIEHDEEIENEKKETEAFSLDEAPPSIEEGDSVMNTGRQIPSRASGIQARAPSLGKMNLKTPAIVKGKVLSAEDGQGLPGVNVLVSGTNKGTVTDAEGKYEIPLSNPEESLVFSFIGLKDVEVVPGDKKEVNVKMSPDYAQLSEVVVTGGAGNNEHPALQFAEPQGGRNAFQKYLKEKMIYPQQALENKVEGRVTIEFTVQPNGDLADFKVLKGIGYGCDDELIRLVKEGPAWTPSKRNDQPVKDNIKVRLKFDIPGR